MNLSCTIRRAARTVNYGEIATIKNQVGVVTWPCSLLADHHIKRLAR